MPRRSDALPVLVLALFAAQTPAHASVVGGQTREPVSAVVAHPSPQQAVARDLRTLPPRPGEPVTIVLPAVSGAQSGGTRPQEHNPLRIALLRWWDVNQSEAFVASTGQPAVLAFDGRDLWVGREDGRLEEIQTHDVTLVDTYQLNLNMVLPGDLAFDGKMVWITSKRENIVTRARASDGVALMYLNAGRTPVGLAFDGKDMWIASRGDNWVMRVHADEMVWVASYPVSAPEYVAFDGKDMWVTSRSGGTVTKLSGSDGAILGTFPVGALPERLAFDGSSMWVVNSGSHNVMRLRINDGALLGTFPVGMDPHGICFDGENVWISNSGSDDVTVLRASDGAQVGTFPAGDGPQGIAFDGANVWVANRDGKSVRKM